MPRKPITLEELHQAIDRLKGKQIHKRRRVILCGHTDQQPMYDWPSIFVSTISKEIGCARGTLYSLANENRKKNMADEEIKIARRFYRTLKPFMRIKKNSDTPLGKPKRNTLEFYKELAQKRGLELKKYKYTRKELLENKLEYDEFEEENKQLKEINATLRESKKEAEQELLDARNSNKKATKENRELRRKLMLCESKTRASAT